MSAIDAVFKAYDIRGTVPEELDADLCRRVGAAFARFTGAPRVLVARDMRPSGIELSRAFVEGLTGAGVDVVELGLASTDLLYYAAGALDAPGAMFTASHNPARYNGIKLCLAGAAPVGLESGLVEIKAMASAGIGPTAAVPGTVSERDLIEEYARHVRTFLGVAPSGAAGDGAGDGSTAGDRRPLRIVADTANGMGGLVVPRVFAALPYELEILYGELDGTFPNHPADPIQPENLRDLAARVLETGADLGLAFDGDADRVFLVDERAQALSGSLTTSLVAAAMLDRSGPGPVIYNLICSKAVPEIIREHGGTPLRSRVGHSYIKATMAETGAVFGGEHSGHYYFRDNYRADSGLIASMIVLGMLAATGQSLSELRTPFERYADSGEVNSVVDDPHAAIERLAHHFGDASQDRLDGLTVDLGDWWFNLRPSNTEPLLRLNLEAADRPSCDAHLAEVLALIRGPVAAA